MRGDDDAGSTNANDDDKPPCPPPENDGNTPRGEGDGTTMVPDDDVTAVWQAGMLSRGRARSVVRERAICVRRRMAWVGS
jgi:hypothetical protein